MLQWGHGLSAVETGARRRRNGAGRADFNGATAFQPWKRGRVRRASGPLGVTSMGPRPFSRGNDVSKRTGGRRCDYFNGATAFQPWKPVSSTPAHPRASDFNGATAFQPWKQAILPIIAIPPTHFNGATAFQPWKREKVSAVAAWLSRLQWGHGLSAVET